MKLKTRGNSLQLDFHYRGKRYRPVMRGLRANNRLHVAEANNIASEIAISIIRQSFCFSTYFPEFCKKEDSLQNSDLSVRYCLEKWISLKQKDTAKSTHRDYRSSIYCHLVPIFGDLKLSEFRPFHVNNWISTLSISNKRINNVLIPLRQVFHDAYINELIDSNPLEKIPSLKVKKVKVHPWSPEHMHKIIDACEGQNKNLIQFAFFTGLRTSEYIALRWEDVDLENGTVFVHRARTSEGDKETTKTPAGTRTIELLEPAKYAIQNQRIFSSTDHVFLNPKNFRPWKDDQSVRKTLWIPALKKAGLKYKKPYTTRHTFCSMLLTLGAELPWLAEQMGHTDYVEIRNTYGSYIKGINHTSSRLKQIIKDTVWTQEVSK